MAAPPSDRPASDPVDPALAAQGLGFTPPGAPPTLTPDVPAGVLLQSGEVTTPEPPPAPPPAPAAAVGATEFTPPGVPPTPDAAATAAAAPDAGSFAPPPMPSEQATETAP